MFSTWEVTWLFLLGRDEAPQLGAVLRIEGYQRRLALQHGEEQLAAGQQRVAIQLAARGPRPPDGAGGRGTTRPPPAPSKARSLAPAGPPASAAPRSRDQASWPFAARTAYRLWS